MNITEMSALTVKDVARLEAECFAHPWTEESIRESFGNPDARFFVAKNEQNEVVGYISYYQVRDEAFINNVAVTASARRQHVGTALVEEALKTAKGEGASFLSLEVRLSNAPAIALYQKLGFESEGFRKKFYRDPTEDALILTVRFAHPGAPCCINPDEERILFL